MGNANHRHEPLNEGLDVNSIRIYKVRDLEKHSMFFYKDDIRVEFFITIHTLSDYKCCLNFLFNYFDRWFSENIYVLNGSVFRFDIAGPEGQSSKKLNVKHIDPPHGYKRLETNYNTFNMSL